MASFETFNLCEMDEYIAAEGNKITIIERLVKDELFLSMNALAKAVLNKPAAKIPIRINRTEEIKNAAHKIWFSLIDDNLMPMSAEAHGTFKDGYISQSNVAISVSDHRRNVPVKRAYLLDRRGTIDDQLAIWAGQSESVEDVWDVETREFITV